MTKPTHIHKQEGISYCGKPVGSDPFNIIEDAFTYNRESRVPCVGCIRRIKAYLDTEVTSRVKPFCAPMTTDTIKGVNVA